MAGGRYNSRAWLGITGVAVAATATLALWKYVSSPSLKSVYSPASARQEQPGQREEHLESHRVLLPQSQESSLEKKITQEEMSDEEYLNYLFCPESGSAYALLGRGRTVNPLPTKENFVRRYGAQSEEIGQLYMSEFFDLFPEEDALWEKFPHIYHEVQYALADRNRKGEDTSTLTLADILNIPSREVLAGLWNPKVREGFAASYQWSEIGTFIRNYSAAESLGYANAQKAPRESIWQRMGDLYTFLVDHVDLSQVDKLGDSLEQFERKTIEGYALENILEARGDILTEGGQRQLEKIREEAEMAEGQCSSILDAQFAREEARMLQHLHHPLLPFITEVDNIKTRRELRGGK